MARYIGIDSNTGYIFFDTGDLDGAARQETPAEAVERFERFENVRGGNSVTYIEHSRAPDGASGYHVYRADIDGSEAVAITQDGQDQEVIEAVERDCEHVCFVEVRGAEGTKMKIQTDCQLPIGAHPPLLRKAGEAASAIAEEVCIADQHALIGHLRKMNEDKGAEITKRYWARWAGMCVEDYICALERYVYQSGDFETVARMSIEAAVAARHPAFLA